MKGGGTVKVCKKCGKRKKNDKFPVEIPGMFGFRDVRSVNCRPCMQEEYASQKTSEYGVMVKNVNEIFSNAKKMVDEIF